MWWLARDLWSQYSLAESCGSSPSKIQTRAYSFWEFPGRPKSQSGPTCSMDGNLRTLL